MIAVRPSADFLHGVRAMKRSDFREYLFTATGRDTPLPALTLLDFEDNVIAELRRLETMAELMQAVNAGEANGELLKSSGAMLSEVQARLRCIVELGLDAHRPMAGRAKAKPTRKSRS